MNKASGTDALMPLSQAAIEVYAAATGEQAINIETLTVVAWTIASRIRVFTREHGANEFALNLSVHRDELPLALAEIRKLYEQRRI